MALTEAGQREVQTDTAPVRETPARLFAYRAGYTYVVTLRHVYDVEYADEIEGGESYAAVVLNAEGVHCPVLHELWKCALDCRPEGLISPDYFEVCVYLTGIPTDEHQAAIDRGEERDLYELEGVEPAVRRFSGATFQQSLCKFPDFNQPEGMSAWEEGAWFSLLCEMSEELNAPIEATLKAEEDAELHVSADPFSLFS
jgi:hypothetical protein